MSEANDGMNYAPTGKPNPVVEPGDFQFAAAGLDHGHISGMCNGLLEAGAKLKYVWDPDPAKVDGFCQDYPGVRIADSLEQILDDTDISLVASAAVPCDRGPLGIRVMQSGKDYFCDKTPFTTLDQLEDARQAVAETQRKYAVYYSERLHVECAVFAGDLIRDGVIGEVIQLSGFGPHRHAAAGRPGWFYEKSKTGGILCDIGSHQCEQFLFYTGASDASVASARVANFANPEHPEFEDFGEAHLVGNNGTSFFYRVDWFTPDGLRTWGDGRTLILGTKGFIELRKYIDVAREGGGDRLFLVTDEGEQEMKLEGQVGYPYFGQLILDCLNRTENAMTQAHTFKAAELCLRCQAHADEQASEFSN